MFQQMNYNLITKVSLILTIIDKKYRYIKKSINVTYNIFLNFKKIMENQIKHIKIGSQRSASVLISFLYSKFFKRGELIGMK